MNPMGEPIADTPGQKDPGPGRRIGIDVGKARIGIAVSDFHACLATPVKTIQRNISDNTSGPTPDVVAVAEVITEYEAVEIVMGLPRNMDGTYGFAAAGVTEYAQQLQAVIAPMPVRLWDERLTTVIATRAMTAVGRKTRKQRSVIDQVAAVEILQTWLDARTRVLEQALE